MGRLAWEPEQWPDPVKMLADLKEKGVNMVAISQPFVLKNGKALDNFNFMNDRRMFGRDSLGNTHEVTSLGRGGGHVRHVEPRHARLAAPALQRAH